MEWLPANITAKVTLLISIGKHRDSMNDWRGKPQRLKQPINIFFLLQTTEYLPYYKHKCLDSEPSTFLLANRYIIFNKFDKDIVPHRIMTYTGDLPGQWSQT